MPIDILDYERKTKQPGWLSKEMLSKLKPPAGPQPPKDENAPVPPEDR